MAQEFDQLEWRLRRADHLPWHGFRGGEVLVHVRLAPQGGQPCGGGGRVRWRRSLRSLFGPMRVC